MLAVVVNDAYGASGCQRPVIAVVAMNSGSSGEILVTVTTLPREADISFQRQCFLIFSDTPLYSRTGSLIFIKLVPKSRHHAIQH